jgi:hypothetical protein
VVGEQCETLASKVNAEVLHGPYCSLHFQEEWHEVLLLFGQLLDGVRDDLVFTLLFSLGEDDPILQACCHCPDCGGEEVVWVTSVGVTDHRVRA